jgi:hypothetical protein
MVLGDGTEVRMGNTYGQGGEWEIRGEVRKWMDVPLHYAPFKSAASRRARIARKSPDLLW